MPLEYVTAMVVLFNQLRKNDAVNILKHLLWSKITKALPAVCAIKYSLLSITLTILFNLDVFQQLLFWKEVGDDLIIKCERSSATNIKALGDRPVSNEYYIYTKRTGVLFDCPFLSFC